MSISHQMPIPTQVSQRRCRTATCQSRHIPSQRAKTSRPKSPVREWVIDRKRPSNLKVVRTAIAEMSQISPGCFWQANSSVSRKIWIAVRSHADHSIFSGRKSCRSGIVAVSAVAIPETLVSVVGSFHDRRGIG